MNALVFVNAMIPSPGQTPGGWWEGGYGNQFDPFVHFLHDVPPEVAAEGEPHQRPEADTVFGSTCSFDPWPSVPIRVVAGADDRFFPIEFQRSLARDRLGVEADVLPGGHLIALAKPPALAEYLLSTRSNRGLSNGSSGPWSLSRLRVARDDV